MSDFSSFTIQFVQVLSFSYASNTLKPDPTEIRWSLSPARKSGYDEASGSFNGSILLHCEAQTPDNVLQLQASIIGFFSMKGENTPQDLEGFDRILSINGAYSLIPILRARISACSAALGSVPLLLPGINIPELKWTKTDTAD